MNTTRAVERVWFRNEEYVYIKIVRRLMYRYNIYELTEKEMQHEAMVLYFLNFYDYYENDEQYNSFIFVCCANYLKNLRLRKRVYNKYHVFDPQVIAGNIGLVLDENKDKYIELWNNLVNNSDIRKEINFLDILKQLKEKISNKAKRVLDCFMKEYNVRETCEELDISACAFNSSRKEIRYALRQILEA